MESAQSMLRRVEPLLREEYPHMPVDIRREVVGSLPYYAGMAEAYSLLLGELYTPEMRLELWVSVMHGLVRELLSRSVVAN